MKALVKFHADCGRGGSISGMFIAEKEVVEKTIGKELYFGEVLGKHSEVYGPLERNEITYIDVPQDVIEALEKATGKTTLVGYNPLNYLAEQEIEEENEDSLTLEEADNIDFNAHYEMNRD